MGIPSGVDATEPTLQLVQRFLLHMEERQRDDAASLAPKALGLDLRHDAGNLHMLGCEKASSLLTISQLFSPVRLAISRSIYLNG